MVLSEQGDGSLSLVQAIGLGGFGVGVVVDVGSLWAGVAGEVGAVPLRLEVGGVVDQQAVAVVDVEFEGQEVEGGAVGEAVVVDLPGGEGVGEPEGGDGDGQGDGGVGAAALLVAGVEGDGDGVGGDAEVVADVVAGGCEAVAEEPVRRGAVGRAVFDVECGVGEVEAGARGPDGGFGVGEDDDGDGGGVLHAPCGLRGLHHVGGGDLRRDVDLLSSTAVAQEGVVGGGEPYGRHDAAGAEQGGVATAEDGVGGVGGDGGVAQGGEGDVGGGGAEGVGGGGEGDVGGAQRGPPADGVQGVVGRGAQDAVADVPLFLHVALRGAAHFGLLAFADDVLLQLDGGGVRLQGAHHYGGRGAAVGSGNLDAHADLVVAVGGETVAHLPAPEGVEHGGAEGVAVDDPAGGVVVNVVLVVGDALFCELHRKVAVGYGGGVGSRLVVGYVGVDARGDGFGGVESGGHHAHEGLLRDGVAGVGALGDHEVGQRGRVGVGVAHLGHRAEGHGVHVEGVVEVGFQAPGGHEPLVRQQPPRGGEGGDGAALGAGAARRVDAHRLVVAADVGVDGVHRRHTVGGVQLYADVLVEEFVHADGHLGPRFVDVGAGCRGTGCPRAAHHPRCIGDSRRGNRRRRDAEPHRVVDGGVGPGSVVVLFDNPDHELARHVGRVVVAPSHHGIVDNQQGVHGRYAHGVEQRFGAFVGGTRAPVGAVGCTLIRRPGVAQADARHVSRRYPRHAHSVVHRQLVGAGVDAGDDHEPVVLGGIPEVAVVATVDARIGTCVEAGRHDVVVAGDVGAVAGGAGAVDGVAGGRSRRYAVAYARSPIIEGAAGAERRCVAEARAVGVQLPLCRQPQDRQRNQE